MPCSHVLTRIVIVVDATARSFSVNHSRIPVVLINDDCVRTIPVGVSITHAIIGIAPAKGVETVVQVGPGITKAEVPA